MNVGEVFTKLALDQKQYEKDFDKAEAYTRQKAMTLGGIFKGAFSFAVGMGIFQGFRSLTGALADFVNTASRTETLDVAMTAIARSTGNNIAVLREQRDVMQDLGIAQQEGTQMLNRFMQAQLDVTQAAKLARVAQDAAVIAGYNSSEAAEQLTEAIATQRPQLLKAFGMSKDLTDIYSDYAKKLGIVVNTTDKYGKTSNRLTRDLTDAEKRQAMLNHILLSGERIAGTYEASMGSVGKKIGSLKRYWDTLKNAMATPTALPILGVIVDGITNSLKDAIKWAEANRATLQVWGQTAANAAKTGMKWMGGFARVMATNWGHIKVAAIMMLTYAVAAKTAAIYTGLLSTATLALKGELIVQAGLLGLVSKAIGIYRLQLALASMQGVVMTGVLTKLRVALYSTLTALGPIGWALIGLSLLVGAGMALWNRYTKSLQKPVNVAVGVGDLKKAEAAIQGAADGAEDQSNALKKAGKAAKDNLQAFDEVHQLQDSTGGLGDILDPDADLSDFTLPELDFADMFAGFDAEAKPFGEKLKGFFNWIWDGIKEGASGLWSGVKDKWGGFKNWASNFWDGTREKWEGFKDWVSGWTTPFWDGAKESWGSFKNWAAGLWDDVKEKWGGFTAWVSERWSSFRITASEIWGGIKSVVQTRWEELQASAPATWENIKTSIQTRWNALKTSAPATWENIKTAISSRWNALKAEAPLTWESIKTAISSRWNALKAEAPLTWESIKTAISSRWNALKAEAPLTWESIKTSISTNFDQAKESVKSAVSQTEDSIAEAWNAILTGIREKATPLYDKIVEPWTNAKATILEIVQQAKDWGSNMISNIIDGIKSKISDLKSAVSNVANTITNFLGFRSPTKEGPGRDADQWAPNLMQMYAQGIRQNAYMVQGSVSAVAEQLSRLAATPSPAFAGAGTGSGTSTVATGPVHLHVGMLVADDLGLKKLEQLLAKFRISEDQRTGQVE